MHLSLLLNWEIAPALSNHVVYASHALGYWQYFMTYSVTTELECHVYEAQRYNRHSMYLQMELRHNTK